MPGNVENHIGALTSGRIAASAPRSLGNARPRRRVRLPMRYLLVALVLASCAGPAAQAVGPAAEAAPSGSAALAPDAAGLEAASPSGPEVLVRAVFEAIRSGDADAYARLTPIERADFEALAATTQPPGPLPSDAEVAARRAVVVARFRAFLDELRGRGLDPSRAELAEVRTDRAVVQGEIGFAEDLTAVIRSGSVTLQVTLDDCVMTPRGWLVADRLRFRE